MTTTTDKVTNETLLDNTVIDLENGDNTEKSLYLMKKHEHNYEHCIIMKKRFIKSFIT